MAAAVNERPIPTGEGLTFEKVWAMFQETDRKFQEIAERQKEAERQMREAREESERQRKEAQEEAERQRKEDRENAERQKKEAQENAERREKESEQREKEAREEAERQREERKRQREERDAEFNQRMKKNDEEFKQRRKESDERFDKLMGKLGNRLGELIEYMVMPNLIVEFRKLGFVFEKAYPHAVIKDKKNNASTEVDITLEDGDKVMLVEVKTKPNTGDITEHVERMEKVKAHASMHGDKRKYLGAVAGMVFNDNEKAFAMKNGFYVVEPCGETFAIIEPKGAYSPREW